MDKKHVKNESLNKLCVELLLISFRLPVLNNNNNNKKLSIFNRKRGLNSLTLKIGGNFFSQRDTRASVEEFQ